MQWGLGRRASRTGRGDALVGLTRAAPALQARPSMAAPLIAATLLSVDRVFKTDGLRRALCAAAIHPFGASTVVWPIISETPSQSTEIKPEIFSSFLFVLCHTP